jgi:phosphoserine phosphatase
MRYALTMVAPPDAVFLPETVAAHALEPMGARLVGRHLLGERAMDLVFEGPEGLVPRLRQAAHETLRHFPLDHCVQPYEGRRKRLLLADMDSTIIGCECLDELADFAGVKDQVAAITERAMRGEIAFEAALKERVAMIAGLPVADLERCYEERVRLNPGAAILARTMAADGARCVLVSGGFTFFAAKVVEAAGFHEARANWLKVEGGRLTGEVGEPILGREAKLQVLNEEAAALGIGLDEALAVGDGANDLAMIEAAGLGVAWRAKPITAARADARVDRCDLTAILYFQGYREDEFVSS